jgi:hypothetical protein
VGKTTTVILHHKKGFATLGDKDVDKIREIWVEIIKAPDPPEAMQHLSENRSIKLLLEQYLVK